MMTNSKTMKVLNIIAGVLLIAAGVYCLCNQDIAALTAGLMVGIFMLVSGVIEIVVFAATSGVLFGSVVGWYFDGDFVAVPAVQPVVHHDVAAASVHSMASVFRHLAVCQRI